MAHDGTADAAGGPGIERGTYAWNRSTGAITANIVVDTNGEWGLSHAGEILVTVSNDGNTLLVDGAPFGTRIP